MSRKLSIILRGHIRGSFENKDLYDYIKELNDQYDLTIYIQTWNILQTNVSWRYMEKNDSLVTEELIKDYFDDLSVNIKKIIILDDSKIDLIGKTTGRMGKTSGSYLGWKQMWYGIYEIAEYIKRTEVYKSHYIINTRFDVFNNSVSFSKNMIVDKLNDVMKSSSRPETIKKNIFLKDMEFFGMDNFYIGNSDTIFKLTERFKFHLDEIIIKYPNVTSHEFYTFHVNNVLFLDNRLNNKKTEINTLLNNIVLPEIVVEDKQKALSLFDKDHNNLHDKKPLPISLLNQSQNVVTDKLSNLGKNDTTLLSNSSRFTEPIKFTLNEDSYLEDYDKTDESFSNSDEPSLISYQGSNSITTLPIAKHKMGDKLLISMENDFSPQTKEDELMLLKPGQGTNSKLLQLEQNKNGDNTEVVFIEAPKLITFANSQSQGVKLSLLESRQSDDLIDNLVSDSPAVLTLLSSQNRGGKLTLIDNKSRVDSIDNISMDSPPVLTLPSSQTRGGKLGLFDPNSQIVGNFTTDSIQPLTLTSLNKNSKQPLFESGIPVPTVSSIHVDSNQLLTLSSVNHSKGNKMVTIDSTPNVSNIKMDSNLLVKLSSANQPKGNKMSLVDSTVKVSSDNGVNKEVLSSSNTFRRGCSSLIDSIKTEATESLVTTIDIPNLISSRTNRSSKPLINIDKVDTSSSFNNNSILLLNKNTRTHAVLPIVKSDPVEDPILEPTDNSSELDKEITIYEEEPMKYINVIPRQNPIITYPIPISKFSVSLDPNYLNVKDVEYATINSAKLIHGNKFKTNTQTLNSYYALLSN